MDCCQRLNHVLWRGWVYWLRAILSERILYHTEENEQSGNQLRYFGSDCILLHIQPSIASCYFVRFCVLFLGWDEKRRTFHWLFYFVVYFHIVVCSIVPDSIIILFHFVFLVIRFYSLFFYCIILFTSCFIFF